MLRSPFAGLSISGTALCLSLHKTKSKDLKQEIPHQEIASDEISIIKPFDDSPLDFLDEEDKKKYQCGKDVYERLCKKAKSENVSSLISWLWYNEGYRYETEWHSNTNIYREYFDYLYHLAVKADNANQGLAVFTEQIRALRDSKDRLKDIIIPLDRPGAVHLLTIHKSKGLEFPVVFICCCGKHSKSNKSKKIYDSKNAGIVFAPPLPAQCGNICNIKKNFFWEQEKTEENRKSTAELRRLLYVAMTRAEEKLFLTGVLNLTDDSDTEDFSLRIKYYAEKKINDKENKKKIYIEGDTIINNDTLFGILLPSIASHIPAEGLKNNGIFFNIEAIPSYTNEYTAGRETNKKEPENNQKGLNEYISNAEIYYTEANIINTPVLNDNHITPVSLYREEDKADSETSYAAFLSINKEFSGDDSSDIFSKVDSLLSRIPAQNSADSSSSGETSRVKFNSGSFGTIAHICVESLLNKEETVIPSNISCLLKPAELSSFIEAGNEIAKRFLLSPLGKIAESAALRENEFSFRSIIKKDKKEVFINGVIDLIFDDKDCIHVVDFKTDSKEIPSEHTAQMACYYHAVLDIFAVPSKKQCRIWLYYLRTGHAVEMTERVKQFKIERRAFYSEE